MLLIESLVARLSIGSAAPGLYLPVSTPCASGEKTTCQMPSATDTGNRPQIQPSSDTRRLRSLLINRKAAESYGWS